MWKKKVGVLISGNGSNLQALIDATRHPSYPAEIVVVISNKADAFGLTRARDAGIPAYTVDHKDYHSREAFDDAMDELLKKHEVEIICLAGFMRLLSAGFVGRWRNRILNIHPSLLPAFKGANAVADAMKAGVKTTGCTVHFVVPEVDSGQVILNAEVTVIHGESEAALHQRIHMQEHIIYPMALKMVAAKLK